MTDTRDLTDDELAAMLAGVAWTRREFAYTGSDMEPEEFAALVATPGTESVDPTPDLLERTLTVLERHAFDDRVAFKNAEYDGPPAEKAFILTETPPTAALAFDYGIREDRRIRDFIAARAPEFVPESLADRVDG